MADETELKQNFLYDEIIAQNYEPEPFQNFMGEAKEDGTNIDNWTMEELFDIVQRYKATFSISGVLIKQQTHLNQVNEVLCGLHQHNQAIEANQQSIIENSECLERNDNVPSQVKRDQQLGLLQSIDNDNPFEQIQMKKQTFLESQKTIITPSQFPIQSQTIKMQPLKQEFSFDQPIAFDEGLSKLVRKKDNFDFDQGFQNVPFQQQNIDSFKNNDIWKFSLPLFQQQSSNQNPAPGSETQKQIMNFSEDPFSFFQKPVTSNSESNLEDPFSGFYSIQPQQKTNLQNNQVQKPAEFMKQNYPDQDFDIFGISIPKQESTQTNVQKQKLTVFQNEQEINKKNHIEDNSPVQIGVNQCISNIETSNSFGNPFPKETQKQLEQEAKYRTQIDKKEPQRKKSIVLENQDKFKKEKQCKKSMVTVVGVKPEVKISIIEHRIISGGSLFSIGGSNLAVYHVKTWPQNWVVQRKMSDFVWLRTQLIKMYPGIPVPPLPAKSMKSLDDKLVERRKVYLESFLSELLVFQELKNSKQLTDFLSIADEKTFKQKIKETEKNNKPKILSEIESPSGKIILDKNPECNIQSQTLAEFFDQNDAGYEKLKKLSKQLMEGYSNVGNILHQMGDTFSLLFTNISNYNQKAMVPASTKKLEETYKVMNNMCVLQANSFADQIKLFQNHFYNFFKFHKENLTGLKEVVKTRNELAQALQRKDANEGTGISGIFRSSKETVYNPSKILKELEEQVGYYNSQMVACSRKVLENRASTYSFHFSMFCHLQKSINIEKDFTFQYFFENQMGIVWQEIGDHFKVILSGEQHSKKLEILKRIG